MRCALFWDITQRWVGVLYRRFGTTSRTLGPIGGPETSVQNYHSTLRNIPEERTSQHALRLRAHSERFHWLSIIISGFRRGVNEIFIRSSGTLHSVTSQNSEDLFTPRKAKTFALRLIFFLKVIHIRPIIVVSSSSATLLHVLRTKMRYKFYRYQDRGPG
jgi:hypothetical protein